MHCPAKLKIKFDIETKLFIKKKNSSGELYMLSYVLSVDQEKKIIMKKIMTD